VCTRAQPVGRDERGPRRCRGHDEVGAARRRLQVVGDLHRHTEQRGHLLGVAHRLLRAAREHGDVLRCADAEQGLQLQPRLDARAHDQRMPGVLAGQQVDGEGAGGRRAQVGEVPVVEQDAVQEPGRRGEDERDAAAGGQPGLRVVEEARGGLDDPVVGPVDVGTLDVGLAVVLRELEVEDGRQRHAVLVQGDEPLANRGQRRGGIDGLADAILGEDQGFGHVHDATWAPMTVQTRSRAWSR